MSNYLLEMKNIEKTFGTNNVLSKVSFQLEKGEVHALLGENGAGKSTLMNILGGVIPPNNGEIFIDGKEEKFTSPKQSKMCGIGFVHQELNLINDLKIYENIYLGRELVNKYNMLNKKAMCENSKQILDKMGININPEITVDKLDSLLKQVIEIAKVLADNPKITIMDEPTSALTDSEINNLFKMINRLKDEGVSIIYISHKMKEIFEICDSYTVLRDGIVTGKGKIADVNEEELTKLMVGKTLLTEEYYKERTLDEEVFRVENLSNPSYFENISFSVKKGEILGFTGLAGDDRTELFETIFGFRNNYRGNIYKNSKLIKVKNPQTALKYKIGFVPKNRKENAIINDMTVRENMCLLALDKYKKNGIISTKLEKETFENNKQLFNIKVKNDFDLITHLSGGNQQKVVLAKWLEKDVDLLILDNPTQGIDVKGKSEIYHLITKLAEQGITVIISSPEVQELLKVCDRVITMFNGEQTADLNREIVTEELVLKYATGILKEEMACQNI